MEEDYLKSCRFCLKNCEEIIPNLYSLHLDEKHQVTVVDFVQKITDLKISIGEFLPNGICPACVDLTQKTYNFTQQCILSDNLLKKYVTRREFRKIEQEALLDDSIDDSQLIIIQECHLQGEECKVLPELDKVKEKVELESNIGVSEPKISNYDGNLIENISDAEQELNTVKEQNLDLNKIKPEENKSDMCDQKYKCSSCDQSFGTKEKFLDHEKAHDTTRPFRCNDCPQAFFKQVHLAVHVRSHTKAEEKPFCCKFCGKQYNYMYLLKQHEFKHTGERPFTCTICNKGCVSQNSLTRHMTIHSETYVKKLYPCEICKKNFTYPSYLTTHMKIHSGERAYLCPTCGKGFKQVGQLHVHQRIHSGVRPYKCTMCSERFISKSKLKIHILKHTKEKPYVCELCGAAFRQSYDLKVHLRTHSNEKPIHCSVCGKGMASTGQLKVHLRTHTGERPFSCEVCKKRFATNTTLVKHTRTHSGERPYKCDVCHKDFTQSCVLKVHKRIHDSPKGKNVKKLPTNKIRRRSNVVKKKLIVKNAQPKQEDNTGGTSILTLSGGATVRLALTVPASQAVPVAKQDVEKEGRREIVILPAPIPLLTKL